MNYVPVVAGTISNDSAEVSTALPEVNTATHEDLVGPSSASEDSHMEVQEIELGNIPQSYEVPTTPHTRIHKDHPIEAKKCDCVMLQEVLIRIFIHVFCLSPSPRRTKKNFSRLLREPAWVEAEAEGTSSVKLRKEAYTRMKSLQPVANRGTKIYLAYASYMVLMSTKWCQKVVGVVLRSKCGCGERIVDFLSGQLKRSQDKYVHEILRKFNYSDMKSASTLIDLEKPLVQDGDVADVDEHLYRSMIGSLMYLTASRSAEISTTENGEVKITATIDGHSISITEGSLRRHLKLDDQDGLSSIPNLEIFEQLALMEYHTNSDKLTFQKGAFSPQWRKFNFSRMIFEHMVSNISSPYKFLMYPRFLQICLDMQRNQLQQHTRTYHVPSLSMKVFNNMKRPTKAFSGQEVALFPSMLAVTTPSNSPSRITSSPSPSPEPSHSPEHSPASLPTPEHTTVAASQPSPTQLI
ncbi:hypothetical protein Tco_1122447 [Tanacetum coccineum]|uniref:Uncharacterized protein n=1 Tax=Tanacetum coccineum TaxID=301880 RepID=A0ABQ5J2V4_9ASTR